MASSQSPLKGPFVRDDTFYVFDQKGQLFHLKKGVLEKLQDIKTNEAISHTILYTKDRILVLSESRKMYILDPNSIEPWRTEIDYFLYDKLVIGMLNIEGYVVFSTLIASIVIVDENGRLIQKLEEATGFNKRNIHSLFLDHGKLFAGAEAGLLLIQEERKKY